MTSRSRKGVLLLAALLAVLAAGRLAAGGRSYDALQAAANNGDLAAFRKVLAKNPAAPRKKGAKYLATLLTCAAWGGNRDVVLTVLGQGAKPSAKDDTGQTPIGAAAYQGRRAVVELLLSRGVSPNARGLLGSTPLHDATYGETAAHLAVATLLLTKGATINAVNNFGVTPLLSAIQDENLTMVRLLLGKGASPNFAVTRGPHQGDAPLHRAAVTGNRALVDLLLVRKANVKARNRSGATPLHLAAYKGHADIAGLLLDRGADVNAKNDSGATPLAYARQYGRAAVAALLEKRGGTEQ